MSVKVYLNNLIHTMQPAMMDSKYTHSQTIFAHPTPPQQQQPQQPQLDYFHQSVQTQSSTWNMSKPLEFTVVTQPYRPKLSTNPSRKRSRDHIDDEEVVLAPAEADGAAPMEVIEEPIYGPGMTLLNPSTGGAISAESQSGTWLEEKEEDERVAEEKRIEAQRPILRPSKSSRLDTMASISQVEAPAVATPLPDIDPASAMLGVGWKVMNSVDEDVEAAVRGWARYIENHYPMNNVKIISKSEGREAFLVQSDEGYWLFKEDLDEGRLVSTSWQGCVAGLTSMPMVFEGANTVTAQRSPSPARDEADKDSAVEAGTGMDLD